MKSKNAAEHFANLAKQLKRLEHISETERSYRHMQMRPKTAYTKP